METEEKLEVINILKDYTREEIEQINIILVYWKDMVKDGIVEESDMENFSKISTDKQKNIVSYIKSKIEEKGKTDNE